MKLKWKISKVNPIIKTNDLDKKEVAVLINNNLNGQKINPFLTVKGNLLRINIDKKMYFLGGRFSEYKKHPLYNIPPKFLNKKKVKKGLINLYFNKLIFKQNGYEKIN